ncbi:unnamed protein product [Diabrotica balteata]|uniref:Uncharacterized protein n=1 Tax=Diabrotica balteata TaxID=107213 RepID=A0A9N9ST50_DIABA|nr:unnamed protein product [Diabrotica balteata]
MANIFEILKRYERREESEKRNHFSAFRKPQKTKMTHNRSFPDSTVHSHPSMSPIFDPEDNQYALDTEYYSNNQKNVKWKSPLVFSPGIKFSPNNSFFNSSKENVENDCHNYSFDTNTTSSPRAPRKQPSKVQRTPKLSKRNSSKQASINSNQFPLSDKDYERSQEFRKSKEIDNIEKFSNICSTQLLDGFKTKSTTGTPKILPHSAPNNAVDYYSQLMPLSNRRKARQTPKRERNSSPEDENKENVENIDNLESESIPSVKETSKLDLNSSRAIFNSQHEDDLSEDDLDVSIPHLSNKYLPHNISNEFNPRSQEYIDSKIRNNYPFYPDDFPRRHEVVAPDGYYGYDSVPYRNPYRPPRLMTQPVHCSRYVDYGQPGKTYRTGMPMKSYSQQGYAQRDMMPVSLSQQYVSVDPCCGNMYQTEMAQPMAPLQRTASSEEYAESRPFPLQNITNTNLTTPSSRKIYRDNEVPNSDLNSSFRIQNTPYPRYHNQNIPVAYPQIHSPEYSGYFPRMEQAVPYGYAPEVHAYHNVTPVDKEYLMNKYWGSFNSHE